eukprot:28449_1
MTSQSQKRLERIQEHLSHSNSVSNVDPRISPIHSNPPGLRRINAKEATIEKVCNAMGESGYLIIDDFCDKSWVANTRKELYDIFNQEQYTGRNVFEGFKTQRIYNIFSKTRSFDDIAIHPLILGVNNRFLGKKHLLSAPQAILVAPGQQMQAPHRDDGVYRITRPCAETVINMMFALDDFTEDNGATVIYPGSHNPQIDDPPRFKNRVTGNEEKNRIRWEDLPYGKGGDEGWLDGDIFRFHATLRRCEHLP